MKEPETCPFDVTPQSCEVQVPGVTVTVQVVAVEENPEPVNENVDPVVPDAGVTMITGMVVRVAETMSFPGEPTTWIVHGFLSAVAELLTTKVPVAVCVELLTVHVGEEMIAVLGNACIVQPVSGVIRPVAVKVTVVPGVTEPLG